MDNTVVDLASYRVHRISTSHEEISDDLITAIKILIERLRKANPLDIDINYDEAAE